MLQAINDRIKGWLGIVIVVLIGLPFALWGISSYFDDAGPRYAAKVNDLEISANEFERTVSMQRQTVMRQYNGQMPFDDSVLRERTLTQLVNQRMLEGATFENGYRISDSILSARIRQQFTVDGEFDRLRFESGVASIGMTIPMYEQVLRNELRLQQMQSAIGNSTFITKDEISRLASLSRQTRDISVLTFNIDHFSKATKASDEELKQYYEANLLRFMLPEKVKVDYVEITSDTLSESIVVDEAEIKEMYDEYVASIGGREERNAKHILLSLDEGANKAGIRKKIESIKSELDEGADFAELAKKYSQDSASAKNGGSLGWVALGEMVKPFEQTLFDMSATENGAVSDIVETEFGFHLIQLVDVRSETIVPLGVKRYEYEDELKADAIASMFYDLSERLAATAYENPDSLEVVVQDMGLKVNTSDFFSSENGSGISENNKIRAAAFSPLVFEQGSNSDVIELSPTHVVVLRLNAHEPATAIPLEEVSSVIENILKVQNGHAQTRIAADEVLKKIEAGENPEKFKSDGIKVEVLTSLARVDRSKVSEPSILSGAFEIMPSQDDRPASKVLDLSSGDVAVVVLNKINSPDKLAENDLQVVRSETLRDSVSRDYESVLFAIKAKADIEINSRIIDK